MAVAALVGGSHAPPRRLKVIRWRAASLSASQASVLWSLSVRGRSPPACAVLDAHHLTGVGPCRAFTSISTTASVSIVMGSV